jgi:hypothetical protein
MNSSSLSPDDAQADNAQSITRIKRERANELGLNGTSDMFALLCASKFLLDLGFGQADQTYSGWPGLIGSLPASWRVGFSIVAQHHLNKLGTVGV